MLHRNDLPSPPSTANDDEVSAFAMSLFKKQLKDKEAAKQAEGTPAAEHLTEFALAATSAALEAFTLGAIGFEALQDFREVRTERRLFGLIKRRVEVEGPAWQFFRVRIKEKGTGPKTDAKYVIVFEINAPWLRREIEELMASHGYERTTYYVPHEPWPGEYKSSLPDAELGHVLAYNLGNA